MRSPREVIRRRTNPPTASACRECSNARIENLMFDRRNITFGMRVTAGRSQLQKNSFCCDNYLRSPIHTTEARADLIFGSSSPLLSQQHKSALWTLGASVLGIERDIAITAHRVQSV